MVGRGIGGGGKLLMATRHCLKRTTGEVLSRRKNKSPVLMEKILRKVAPREPQRGANLVF